MYGRSYRRKRGNQPGINSVYHPGQYFKPSYGEESRGGSAGLKYAIASPGQVPQDYVLVNSVISARASGSRLVQRWIGPDGSLYTFEYTSSKPPESIELRSWATATGSIVEPRAAQPPQTVPDESGSSGSAPAGTGDPLDPALGGRKTNDGPSTYGRISSDLENSLRREADYYAKNANYSTLDDLSQTYAHFQNHSLPAIVNATVDEAYAPLFEAAAQWGEGIATEAGAEALAESLGFAPGTSNWYRVVKWGLRIGGKLASGLARFVGNKVISSQKENLTAGFSDVLTRLKNPRQYWSDLRQSYADLESQTLARAKRSPYYRSQPSAGNPFGSRSSTAAGGQPYDPRRTPARVTYDEPPPTTAWTPRRRGGGHTSSGAGYRFHKPYPLVYRRRRRSAYVFSR